MIPTKGQRWFWVFPGASKSETFVEIKSSYRDSGSEYVQVEIVGIKESKNPNDKMGATFEISARRFATSEFEYLPGQDRP